MSKMSKMIKESNIAFSNKEEYLKISGISDLFTGEEEKDLLFGILKIKTEDYISKNKKHLLFFSNDCSGSMQDVCTDGRKKIDHSNHTIINIINLASNIEDCEIWVQIAAFDNEIHSIIPATKVTKENLKTMVEKVNNIIPLGSTNIGLALQNANDEIEKFKLYNKDFDITHILTTDGYITEGQLDNNFLAEKIDTKYTNIFIGYGLDHSAETLISLSKNKNTRYYFIDNIEKGGILYGEIIHNILYKCLRNIRIEAINSEIYDYKKGTWTTSIDIDFLPGDIEKTYHLRTYDPFDVEVDIFGISVEKDVEAQLDKNEIKIMNVMYLSDLVTEDSYNYGYSKTNMDTIRYMFRQKTLELLFEAKNTNELNDIRVVKIKLVEFLNKIKSHIKTKKMEKETDTFYQNLCDDIFITIKTLGTQYSDMYITARERSNANEFAYNIVELPKNISYKQNQLNTSYNYINNLTSLLQPILQRNSNSNSNSNSVEPEPTPTHILSKLHLNRSYTTSKAIDIMRSVSNGEYEEFEY